MGTGFQSHIRRRPTRFVSGISQSKHFRMRLSGLWVEAFADNLATHANKNAANHRVRASMTPEGGQAEGAAHVVVIRVLQSKFQSKQRRQAKAAGKGGRQKRQAKAASKSGKQKRQAKAASKSGKQKRQEATDWKSVAGKSPASRGRKKAAKRLHVIL